jgi:hypothetical protein
VNDPRETHIERQPLNAMDRGLLAVNRALRGMNCPDFSTQALVWLSGRANAVRVRAAVASLGQRYPVLAARLIETGHNGAHWMFRPGAECSLHEAELGSEKPEAVLDFAARLLSEPGDPAKTDPIRFHLIHRPDGRDVFLMQYSHALMDNGDAVPLLRALDQLSGPSADAPCAPVPDLLSEYIRQFPRGKRLKAALRTLDVRFRKLRSPPATLGTNLDRAVPVRFRITTRRLERPAVRAVEQRVIRTCGMPSLSMALLGSAFRAIVKLVGDREAGRNLVAGIGVDLVPPGVTRPVFQTLASVVPIFTRPEALADRDSLLRALHQQFRYRLENAADLGTVQLANFFQAPGARLRQRFADWSVGRLMGRGYSLWYAYFGSLDAVGARFCDTAIEDVYYCASTWPPMGLTLLVNRFRGDLLFQATYIPESVPEPLANQFLDTMLEDLVA